MIRSVASGRVAGHSKENEKGGAVPFHIQRGCVDSEGPLAEIQRFCCPGEAVRRGCHAESRWRK